MSFEDLLKSLQVDYVAALPKKIAIIKSQIHAADLPALRESFHKFKGTGRTYGLPEVSELAEAVERLCIDESSHAITAAGHAVAVLEDIHKARAANQSYSLATDPRYLEIRKHLPR
jgi:HPt (histidine-containing phosphotransfer) domain-containing protein